MIPVLSLWPLHTEHAQNAIVIHSVVCNVLWGVHMCVFSSPLGIPASGRLHDPMLISYTLHNRTLEVQELEARVSTSEAFMYSGKRLVGEKTLSLSLSLSLPPPPPPPPIPSSSSDSALLLPLLPLQSRFRVLPSSSHTLTYNLYPVVAGMVPLPHLDLSYQRDPKTMELVTGSQLPTSIFIKVEREEGRGSGRGKRGI